MEQKNHDGGGECPKRGGAERQMWEDRFQGWEDRWWKVVARSPFKGERPTKLEQELYTFNILTSIPEGERSPNTHWTIRHLRRSLIATGKQEK